ncbi:hypothetical protein [Paracoccus sp. PARArs4]|uniref:hypothetical protein n=1 Tax=Paracoccus sp. PARArs4 TaxID=2853442 RepID=UPI0024A77174|nr:hypothetical protein [Paracoccus sp. PARArs4]
MQMVFHLGVHATDGDRLLRTLQENQPQLRHARTEVVVPERHKDIFDEALQSLAGGNSTPEMEQIMLDAMLEAEDPQRVIMSTATFMGAFGRVVGREGLYPQIGRRAAALTRLFPSARTEFFLAIRNPATLLSDVLPQFTGGDYTELMQGNQPMDLRWRDAIQRLVASVQGRRIVIWCHEDVPLIWPEIVRMVAGAGPDIPLKGGSAYVNDLLTDEGAQQLRDALSGQDQLSVSRRRAIFTNIIAQHAKPDALDQSVKLPGWTQDVVDQVTETYRADVAEIAVLPGVEFILP